MGVVEPIAHADKRQKYVEKWKESQRTLKKVS